MSTDPAHPAPPPPEKPPTQPRRNAWRLFGLAFCLLLGGLAVYLFCARFFTPNGPPTVVPPQTAPAQIASEPDDVSRANTALQKSRQDAENARKPAAETSRLWAGGAVLIGRNLFHKSRFEDHWGKAVPTDGTPEAEEYRRELDALMTETAEVTKLTGDKNTMSLSIKRENIAQFQSRLLSGALELNDDQWRQVDRTLSAYYQEAYSRNLNRDARPQTDLDGWQRQRADLSRRAFAAINTELTPDQSARFRKLYQGETWLWTMDSGL